MSMPLNCCLDMVLLKMSPPKLGRDSKRLEWTLANLLHADRQSAERCPGSLAQLVSPVPSAPYTCVFTSVLSLTCSKKPT